MPSWNGVVLLMLRFRNVQIWAVPTWKEFDLLMLRNPVLRIGNVHIWVMPSCKLVDLLLFRIWVFETAKRSDVCCTEVQGVPFPHCQERRINAAKLRYELFYPGRGSISNMSNAVLKEGRLATSQESSFQAAKRSDMRSGFLQGGRFPETRESRFQGAKRSHMGSAVNQ